MDVEQAEAALVEHYARLVRLAYLVLPPRLGRHRRVLAAHALTQRALPHGRVSTSQLPIPGPRTGVPGWVRPDPAYVWLRLCVLRAALAAQRPRRLGPCRLRALPLLPGLLPWVLGLRLFPRVAGADELTLDHALSRVSAAGRAAYVLRGLEGLAEPDIRRLLRELRVPDPEGALAEANALETPAGSKDGSLLESGSSTRAPSTPGRPICCAAASTSARRSPPGSRCWRAWGCWARPVTRGAPTARRGRRTRATPRRSAPSIRAR